MVWVKEWFLAVDYWAVLSGAALGVLGLGARTIMQAPIKSLTEQRRTIRLLWWLSPQRPFKGHWAVNWKVESDRYPCDNIDVVRVRRLFSNISFTTIATLKDGSTQECVFVGKLVDRSVTGRWFNPEDQEHGYFGAFQFRVKGTLRAAEGMWIGWRNDGTIATGELLLHRSDSTEGQPLILRDASNDSETKELSSARSQSCNAR